MPANQLVLIRPTLTFEVVNGISPFDESNYSRLPVLDTFCRHRRMNPIAVVAKLRPTSP
jgi:hypothetical protein